MASTYRQRYFGEEKENRIQYPYKGQARFLQICLDYEGTDSPLTCTVDGNNLREVAIKNGVKDIVSLYDNGGTELHPSKENVVQQFIEMADRCHPGDIMIFQYSGHGTHTEDQDGDESDGQDEAFCLTTADGQDQLLIDDEVADIVSNHLPAEVPCLFLVDACHSGTILDLKKGGIWGGKQVFSISGCQDDQTSGDTGNGGIMTHALLDTLKNSQCRKLRRKRGASIQYIFNRMVEKMPEEEEEECMGEGEEEGEFEFEEFQIFEDMGFAYEPMEEMQEGEEEQPQQGQVLNISWCGGTDPTFVSFPF